MSITASVKGIDKKDLNQMYANLPIKSRSDIKLDVNKLCKDLRIKPSYWLKDIYKN